MTPLLEIEGISKRFVGRRSLNDMLARRPVPVVRALEGVNLDVRRGETLGIVGESGCGKSTLARCIVRLYEADEGTVRLDGAPLDGLDSAARAAFSRRVQMVFQDPYGSLNPRMTVGQTLAEVLSVHGIVPKAQVAGRVGELLDLVHLPRTAEARYPHEFSGGQRQRIGIARALAMQPDVIIADEPVSALDVSVQAQVVNLFLELQARLGLTLVFITHDLRLVRHLTHRVAVMYLGRIVELGETEALFEAPKHPYTQALLRAVPQLTPGGAAGGGGGDGGIAEPAEPADGVCVSSKVPVGGGQVFGGAAGDGWGWGGLSLGVRK